MTTEQTQQQDPNADASRRSRVEPYRPAEIEPHWQQRWEELGMHRTDLDDTSRPKFYLLTMYDYPSGDLHIGHWYVKTPTDAIGRYKRMKGYNVFMPVGFDAFGLPAENAAIRSGVQPRDWTMRNIDNMRRQLRTMGAAWDWSAELITCEPDYYRWNQWFFLRFLERGLVYRAMAPVDWCPNDGVLAREQVEGAERVCWRCGAQVVKRDLEQWFFRQTAFADELLDHSGIDWPEPIKVMQTNWIGRSEGAEVGFPVADAAGQDDAPTDQQIRVFTTRPDTLFGATFMVLAPEHPLVDGLTAADRRAEVDAYRTQAARKTEIDRLSTEREKSGVALGSFAVNPVNGERIPIWIADYVLAGYGTGAIMAVPAHDERDFEFATWAGLPIRRVVAAPGTEAEAGLEEAYVAHSAGEVLVNSGRFDGLPADEGGRAIVAELEGRGLAKPSVTYRLHDWLFGRQRPWGAPIPIIYCERDGIVPVPDEDLPVVLPDHFDYSQPGSNPLVRDEAFVNVDCPRCGQPARRETDTMDTFVDSSWYWWRYLSPDKTDGPIDRAREERWCPVDQYTGGAEHAVMHLLYSRSFTKALNDMGLVKEREPFLRLFNQGQILGADGERMSKSRGNVQDPDDLVARYGADTVRLFLMFMGPWDQGGPWSPTGIEGVHRFLRRVWTVVLDPHGREPGDAEAGRLPAGQTATEAATDLRRTAHRALKKVTQDHEDFRWNTMIAALMELTNRLMRLRGTEVARTDEWDEAVRLLLLMLAPIAPHIAEELWLRTLPAGKQWRSIHVHRWPDFSPELIESDQVELPVQVNGRLRDVVVMPAGLSEVEVEQIVLSRDKVRAQLDGAEVVRVIHVPGRLVNVVIRPRMR